MQPNRTLRILLAAAVAVLVSLPALAERGDDAQRKSKNGRAEATIGGVHVVVDYGRPSANGREIFGGLVPWGRVWRTGADEATTFRADGDLVVEGQRLPAGTYALFTIPGKTSWTVIFNRVAEQWGAFKYDAGQDALRVEVAPRTHVPVETFTIAVDEGALFLRWADVEVPVTLAAGD